MHRCVTAATIVLALAGLSPSAQAQVHRQFPPNALRGELVVVQPPEVSLNGRAASLSPGSRIRGDTNLLQQSGSLVGQKNIVHYTVDPNGQIGDVWVLNPAELANKQWPRTPQEAAGWSFDPAAQIWTKP
jgi:hypothetical protein